MAICAFCTQEMLAARSCTVDVLHRSGLAVALPRFGEELCWPRRFSRGVDRCGDCGVRLGGYHHLGCDIAECPACGGQLLGCDCHYDEDGPDDEEGCDYAL